jgi:hypothetical protein
LSSPGEACAPEPRPPGSCPAPCRPAERHGGVAAGALDQPAGHAFLVFQQGLEHVFGGDALVAQADRQRLCCLQKALGAIGEFFEVHGSLAVLTAPK